MKKSNGIHSSNTLRPIIHKGRVLEVIGSCTDIKKCNKLKQPPQNCQFYYPLITENIKDFIGITDLNGIILYISPSCESVLGYSPDVLIGSPVLLMVHPEDLVGIESAFNKMVVAKTPCKFRYRCIHRNGINLFVEVKATPLIDKNGEVECIALIVQDIRDQDKTEELIRKWDRLSIAGELAVAVAHEIRNPLTTIKGFIQYFRGGGIKENYYDILLAEIKHIEGIINEFLMLARPQADNFAQTDLKLLLSYVITLLESQGITNKIEIIREIDEDLPSIICDENQIKLAFTNLLINTIESMNIRGKIRVVAKKKDDNWVLLRVIVQGSGMTEDRLKNLGEPFYRTKEKGTGLGLMICYKIIHEHQGEINIDTKIDQGTIVEVKLPVNISVLVK